MLKYYIAAICIGAAVESANDRATGSHKDSHSDTATTGSEAFTEGSSTLEPQPDQRHDKDVVKTGRNINSANLLKIPLGVNDFHEIVSNNYLYCDKTDLIAELLNSGPLVSLISRPRGWGKTLAMSMLQHFFAAEVNGKSTAGLFDDMNIGKLEGGDYIERYQGKHPVILLSFKDVDQDSFEDAYNKTREVIASLFNSFTYLEKSPKLNSQQLRRFDEIRNHRSSEVVLERSIYRLSQWLYEHHRQKVYILIDDFDTPLSKAYGNKDHLDRMIAFMDRIFHGALKDNDALEKGVMTGTLCWTKPDIFSGFNNLLTYTTLDDAYGRHFGFNETEVQSLFVAQGLHMDLGEVKDWYNGYKVGTTDLYNPWSILSCINQGGRLDPYWVNPDDISLIRRLIHSSDVSSKEDIQELRQGKALETYVLNHISYDLIDTCILTFLLFAGYLKADNHPNSKCGMWDSCTLAIPNKEVAAVFNSYFQEEKQSKKKKKIQRR